MNKNPLGNKIVSVIIILAFWAACVFIADYGRSTALSPSNCDQLSFITFVIGILLAIVNWRNNLLKLSR